MKKKQAVTFWKDLQESTEVAEVLDKYKNQMGYGGRRTLERYVQAANIFGRSGSDKEIMKVTSWKARYVGKIRPWWENAFQQVDGAADGSAEASGVEAVPRWPQKPAADVIYALGEVCLQTISVRPIGHGGGLTKDFGPLKAEETRTFVASEALGLKSDELVVLRILVDEDDLYISVREGAYDHPANLKIECDSSRLSTSVYDPSLSSTEFWLWGQNRTVVFMITNPTKYPNALNRVVFFGWSVKGRVVKCPDRSKAAIIHQGWA